MSRIHAEKENRKYCETVKEFVEDTYKMNRKSL